MKSVRSVAVGEHRWRLLRIGTVSLCAVLLSVAASSEASDYLVGIEDKLEISVWREPELIRELTVRPDGKISFPLVGELVAAGRSPRQLQDQVTESLSRVIKEPVVTVIVVESNQFKIYVLGEVVNQGVLTLRRPTRILHALAEAGGLTQYADQSKIWILRDEEGRQRRIEVDYREMIRDPSKNLFLKPGDTIVVN